MNRLTSLFAAAIFLPLVLSACKQKQDSTETKASGASATDAALTQKVTVDDTGFHPEEIKAKAGQKVTLVFHRVTDATCAKQVVFKDLGIKKELPLNQDVEVTVTAKSPKLAFACGMDMLRGSLVVE